MSGWAHFMIGAGFCLTVWEASLREYRQAILSMIFSVALTVLATSPQSWGLNP